MLAQNEEKKLPSTLDKKPSTLYPRQKDRLTIVGPVTTMRKQNTLCALFSGGNGLYFVHLIKTLETAVPKLVFLQHFQLCSYILVPIRNESVSMLAYICYPVYI